MYEDALIGGTSLPNKTLCLTFDDGPGATEGAGPGPQTVALAQYLHDQGVPATFFMVGMFASDLPDILPQVEALGHLIGNHTYDHPNLPQHVALGGDPVAQVARTDGLIRNWIDAPVVFFRPPYGSWDASVAGPLNANLTASLSHVGPIGWDIDGGDWACWRNGIDPQTCLGDYMQAITNGGGRGTVLMHDCTADQDVVKRANRGLELVQLLIPALRQQGYGFARLDDVPEVAAKVRNTARVALKGSNGLYVSPQGGGGGAIIVNGPAVGPWEPLVMQDLYVGKVACRRRTGSTFRRRAVAAGMFWPTARRSGNGNPST